MIEDNTTTLSSHRRETTHESNDDTPLPRHTGIDFVSAYQALIGAYVRTLLRDEPDIQINMQAGLEVAVA